MINSRRSSFKQPCYRKWRASADRLYGDQPDVWAALWVTQETGTGTFKKITSNGAPRYLRGNPVHGGFGGTSRHAFWFNVKFPKGDSCREFANNQACSCRQLIRIAMFSRKKLFGAATVSLKGIMARVWLSNGLISNKTGKEL